MKATANVTLNRLDTWVIMAWQWATFQYQLLGGSCYDLSLILASSQFDLFYHPPQFLEWLRFSSSRKSSSQLSSYITVKISIALLLPISSHGTHLRWRPLHTHSYHLPSHNSSTDCGTNGTRLMAPRLDLDRQFSHGILQMGGRSIGMMKHRNWTGLSRIFQ